MRCYILVEGKCTEMSVYPKWIELIHNGKYLQVNSITELLAKDDTFYIITGGGYPSILDNMLPTSLSEVCDTDLIDHFIIAFDVDEESVESRIAIARSKITDFFYLKTQNIKLQIHIVVQNVCFETWFLGNNAFCTFNSTDKMYLDFVEHYDINDLDPEKLPNNGSAKTTQRFHSSYFKRVCFARNAHYSKNNPSIVCTPEFLQGIVNRINQTNHLNSFRDFHQVISNL